MLQPLLANLAAVAIALIVWSLAADIVERHAPRRRGLLLGAALAAATVASMSMAFEMSKGVFFDLRSPLILLSALFGGTFAALLTAFCAIAYRLYLGGAVLTGIVGIFCTLAVGLAVRRSGSSRRPSVQRLVIAGGWSALVSSIILGWLYRNELADRADNIAAYCAVCLLATICLGSVMLREEQRRRLAALNRQFRAMVDALPDCLNIKDLDGRFIAANPATARLMKAASVRDLIGKRDEDFYPPDIAKQFRQDEIDVMRAGAPRQIEQKGVKPEGGTAWLSTMKVPTYDAQGRLAGLVTTNRDITERKALEIALADTQAYLDQALSNMSDGLAIYDRDARLLFCNDRYRELFPDTAALRVPGVKLAAIIEASIESGEELLPEGLNLAEYVKRQVDDLQRNKDDIIYRANASVYACRNKVLANGNALSVISDVTERYRHERTLEHQAFHDPLTGLPNRAYFNREIERLLQKAQKDDSELVVMLLDLDRFKQVNDRFGHAAGDALLVEVARRLQSAARGGDFVARLGGDEFAILVPGPTNGVGDVRVATRIVTSLAKPMSFGDVTLLPGGTIGYTIWPKDNSDSAGLLKNADKALYAAKAKGRGNWQAYDPTLAEPEDRKATA